MSEPSFTQHQHRSLLVPTLLALVFVALAVLLARSFFPATTINLAILHTDVLAESTLYKSDSIVLGPAQDSHTLFVIANLRVDNQHRQQIFLDDFTLTVTDPTGAQLTAKAIQKLDLPNAELSFPRLKPLMAAPLLRDTAIDPGKSAQGTVVFSLDIPQSTWDTRKSAALQVDIYHNHPVNADIPR